MKIDCKKMHYKELNEMIKKSSKNEKEIELVNVLGHRYIGTGLSNEVKINIYGTPGNDLGAFMNGPFIEVHGNAQDAVGNTMNSGNIVIHGSAGNVLGYSMRDGYILVEGNVGYRAGIHMKAFEKHIPTIIIGGKAGSFLGEYMAGGRIIVLNLNNEDNIIGDYTATGMHGGEIFVRNDVKDYQIWPNVKVTDVTKEDLESIRSDISMFCKYFSVDTERILKQSFKKITPISSRPYKKMYA